MSTARELADFITRSKIGDLPARTIEHAAMLIASTISKGNPTARTAQTRDPA